MRIQHNIMAMNAYRNYNTNTSALSKNLEKLSSGYKINRAGDAAAGLAISEEMRAQITGLNAAQKNVKDGISLVKTAEGAMQEIQDMLNRMDYLATQSANGTYDDEVDRANLQKEVDQLLSEINRIADSSNFNGIKLLDGSLDPNATEVGKTDASAGTVASLVTSTKGTALGTDTVEHSDSTAAAKTKFGVALHEVKFANNAGEGIKISIGGDDNYITIKGGANGAAGTEMTAKDIVDYLVGNSDEADTDKLEFGGNIEAGAAAGKIVIDGETFSISAGADGTTLVFEQDSKTSKHIVGDMEVKVTGAGTAAKNPTVTGTIAGTFAEGTAGAAAASQTYELTISGLTKLTAGDYNVTIGGQTVTVTFDADVDTDVNDALAGKLAAALANKFKDGFDDGATPANDTYYSVTANGAKLTLEASKNGTGAAAVTGGIAITPANTVAAGPDPVSGDYNMKTTVTTQGVDAGASRIASGVVTLTGKEFADGTIIKIGNKEYTVTTDKANANSADHIYVGDLDLSRDLQTAIDRLTVKADTNEVWTVGQGPTSGTVTFVEKVDAQGKSYTEQKTGTDGKLADGAFDLTKESVIKGTFGIVTGKAAAKAGEAGKAMILQIGDTSDSYNQLKVEVGDMHAKALGLEGLKINTSETASAAIQKIKDAINQVSSVRGTLGATQNRLEHTANNLSVMAENIQDAESTIRDTDVAEEIMAYTKNNILIQSAQAMLAQANAVPQGVLQLLG